MYCRILGWLGENSGGVLREDKKPFQLIIFMTFSKLMFWFSVSENNFFEPDERRECEEKRNCLTFNKLIFKFKNYQKICKYY